MRTEPEATKAISSLSCARQVVETVPVIMRLIRSGVRDRGGALSVPQIRLLSLISRHPGASVSDVAAYLDVTIPTASGLVDRLVKKFLLERHDDPTERRRVVLTITEAGQRMLDDSRTQAQQYIADWLQSESPEQLKKISEGLELLANAALAFSPQPRSSNGNHYDSGTHE